MVLRRTRGGLQRVSESGDAEKRYFTVRYATPAFIHVFPFRYLLITLFFRTILSGQLTTRLNKTINNYICGILTSVSGPQKLKMH